MGFVDSPRLTIAGIRTSRLNQMENGFARVQGEVTITPNAKTAAAARKQAAVVVHNVLAALGQRDC